MTRADSPNAFRGWKQLSRRRKIVLVVAALATAVVLTICVVQIKKDLDRMTPEQHAQAWKMIWLLAGSR